LSNAGTPAPTGIQSSSSDAGTSANVDNSNPSAPSVRTINATLTAQLANPFRDYATKGDIASATAALDAQFQSQLTALASAVSAPASGLSAPITVQAFAPSQRINNLTNITVSGVSGLTASDIPSLGYLPITGGTISGNLTVSGAFTGGTLSLALASTTALTATNATLLNASTSLLSVYGPAYFGSTATSTFSTDGSLTLAKALSVASGGTGWANINSGSILFGNGSAAVATSSNLFGII
jgi:hypothetical protein